MLRPVPLRSPTQGSSTELTSPTSLASPSSPQSRRRGRKASSGPEPIPDLDSDATGGNTAESTTSLRIPHTTLLSPSPSRQPKPGSAGEGRSQAVEQGSGRPTRQSSIQGRAIPHQSESDRTDALWAEMQATLADVELSAGRGGTHFFGDQHSAALEELRNAQMALAHAWAQGDDSLHQDNAETLNEDAVGLGGGRSRANTAASSDSGKSPGTSIKGAKGTEPGGPADADADAMRARARREANDRYFQRIQEGVMDVVEKLEGVATAMGKVERESREIWLSSDDDDDEPASP